MNPDYLDSANQGYIEVTCELPEGYKHPKELQGRLAPLPDPCIRRIPKNFGHVLKIPACMRPLPKSKRGLDVAVWEFEIYTDLPPHRAKLVKVSISAPEKKGEPAGDHRMVDVWPVAAEPGLEPGT